MRPLAKALLLSACLLTGCASSISMTGPRGEPYPVDLDAPAARGSGEPQLRFGVTNVNTNYEWEFERMREGAPLTSLSEGEKNVDVVLHLKPHGSFSLGFQAFSAYTQELLVQGDTTHVDMQGETLYRRVGRMVYDAFVPGGELYRKVIAQRPAGLPAAEAEPAARPAAVAARAGALSSEQIAQIVQATLTAQSAKRAPTAAAAAGAPASDVDRPRYKRTENPDDVAVVVGVEKYTTGLPAATFAAHDAAAVREHLMALGVPPRNIMMLQNEQASRASLAKALNSWLPNRVKPDSTVFFYYSGHGAPDLASKQAYLVPADGDPEDLEDTAYPLKQLYEKLGALKAGRVIVALDSCFSGAGGRSLLAKGARPLVQRIESDPASSQKLIVFSASKSEQISGSLDDQGHGAFTYFLLKGLDGGAQDRDGHVTVKALQEYLAPKVADAARLQNRDQEPQLYPAQGERLNARLR